MASAGFIVGGTLVSADQWLLGIAFGIVAVGAVFIRVFFRRGKAVTEA